MISDQEALRRAERGWDAIPPGHGLRPLQLALRIERETGCGADAARLVVMARSASPEETR